MTVLETNVRDVTNCFWGVLRPAGRDWLALGSRGLIPIDMQFKWILKEGEVNGKGLGHWEKTTWVWNAGPPPIRSMTLRTIFVS